MLTPANNSLVVSNSPHSLGLQNDVTVPSWGDSNYFVNAQKAFNSQGISASENKVEGLGCGNCGMGALSLPSGFDNIAVLLAVGISGWWLWKKGKLKV